MYTSYIPFSHIPNKLHSGFIHIMVLPKVGSSNLPTWAPIVTEPSGLLALKHQDRGGIQVYHVGMSCKNLVKNQVLLRVKEHVSERPPSECFSLQNPGPGWSTRACLGSLAIVALDGVAKCAHI